MAEKRKDNRGRILRTGESQRKDGRYQFQYTDAAGKRHCVYALNLVDLRENEKGILRDLEDGIRGSDSKKITVNQLVEMYFENHKSIKKATEISYNKAFNYHIKDSFIGKKPISSVRNSDMLRFFNGLLEKGLSSGYLHIINAFLHPAFEMAVDDDIIRKNPAKGSISDYGRPAKEREALSISQQEKLIDFVKQSNVYNVHYPMLMIMIGTGLRCGELIGLTWKDVDTRARRLNVDHQLIYKNLGDGCRFHISTPKTDSGIRVIPMTQEVQKAFEEQRKINFMLAKDKSIEVDGYSGFVFTAKSGRPLMPYGVNSVLYNIVDAYNKEEVQKAKKEHRKAELLPKVSAHVMRHTACTRMAECRMDVKVLQYIMGHAHIDVTMEVYNHIGELTRIENEIARLDSMVLNA